MHPPLFRAVLIALAIAFTMAFVIVVVPPLLAPGAVIGAFAAGFVNPFASGYAIDVILCWCVLAAWVVHDATANGVRHGWIALALGVVPGVATGFALYLLIRMRQRPL